MKRRSPAKTVPVVQPEVISPQIMESARQSAGLEHFNSRAPRCVVCGDQSSVDAAEQLCWVCRRLKISAWRDSDHQLPAQE
ncbi:MAG TPA: hypothetical protein VHC90_13630 [Bryobacteraceae bacterium]|nr:hypothetical protein [Bryobacteraceae bacterium]